jgi:hypothetical protein
MVATTSELERHGGGGRRCFYDWEFGRAREDTSRGGDVDNDRFFYRKNDGLLPGLGACLPRAQGGHPVAPAYGPALMPNPSLIDDHRFKNNSGIFLVPLNCPCHAGGQFLHLQCMQSIKASIPGNPRALLYSKSLVMSSSVGALTYFAPQLLQIT